MSDLVLIMTRDYTNTCLFALFKSCGDPDCPCCDAFNESFRDTK